jgi:hypothetical protein
VVFGVGVVTAVINDPDPATEKSASGRVTETTLPAVIEDPAPVTETTVTTAAPAPVEVTPTTVAAPPVTTTTIRKVVAPSAPVVRPQPRPATPTTQAPAPQPAKPAAIDCGTGSASARSYFEQTPTGYQLGAKVINDSTKTIELDGLVVRATYPDGSVKTFAVDVAGKRVDARPGTAEMSFPIPDSAGPTPPSSFEIGEFRFHTAGLPECASQ